MESKAKQSLRLNFFLYYITWFWVNISNTLFSLLEGVRDYALPTLTFLALSCLQHCILNINYSREWVVLIDKAKERKTILLAFVSRH